MITLFIVECVLILAIVACAVLSPTPAQAVNRGFDEHTLEAVTLSVYSRGWVPPRVSVAPETNGRVHPQ